MEYSFVQRNTPVTKLHFTDEDARQVFGFMNKHDLLIYMNGLNVYRLMVKLQVVDGNADGVKKFIQTLTKQPKKLVSVLGQNLSKKVKEALVQIGSSERKSWLSQKYVLEKFGVDIFNAGMSPKTCHQFQSNVDCKYKDKDSRKIFNFLLAHDLFPYVNGYVVYRLMIKMHVANGSPARLRDYVRHICKRPSELQKTLGTKMFEKINKILQETRQKVLSEKRVYEKFRIKL